MATRAPSGLAAGGRALWKGITDAHPDLDPTQLVQLTEACRAKDRLDKLDEVLRGAVATWVTLSDPNEEGERYVVVDKALDKANTTANLLKQLLAALRLPDEQTGRRPQARPGAAVKAPQIPGGAKVIDRAARFAAG